MFCLPLHWNYFTLNQQISHKLMTSSQGEFPEQSIPVLFWRQNSCCQQFWILESAYFGSFNDRPSKSVLLWCKKGWRTANQVQYSRIRYSERWLTPGRSILRIILPLYQTNGIYRFIKRFPAWLISKSSLAMDGKNSKIKQKWDSNAPNASEAGRLWKEPWYFTTASTEPRTRDKWRCGYWARNVANVEISSKMPSGLTER